MTLNEAIASGKRFTREADSDLGDYMTAAEFLEGGITLSDFNATDYILEPIAVLSATIPKSVLEAAWNNSKPSSVALAGSSDFFRRFTSLLGQNNISIS